jgi:hypothetical protein
MDVEKVRSSLTTRKSQFEDASGQSSNIRHIFVSESMEPPWPIVLKGCGPAQEMRVAFGESFGSPRDQCYFYCFETTDRPHLARFRKLASLAYRDSISLPGDIHGLPQFDDTTFGRDEARDADRWMWLVHRLAWAQPDTAKLTARRRAWYGVERIPDHAPQMCRYIESKRIEGILCLQEVPEDSPLPYFSTLTYDVFTSSALAIGLLLDAISKPIPACRTEDARRPETPAPTTPGPAHEDLVLSLRNKRRAKQARLVEFMADRNSATFTEIAEHVHEDIDTAPETVRKLVSETNRSLGEFESRLRFVVSDQHVLRDEPPD